MVARCFAGNAFDRRSVFWSLRILRESRSPAGFPTLKFGRLCDALVRRSNNIAISLFDERVFIRRSIYEIEFWWVH